MATTTAKDIIIAARAKLATMAPSRDASSFFIEHKTNQPFEKTPISKRDGFEIVAINKRLTTAFGTTGIKEEEIHLIVKLGHAPFAKDYEREENMSRDIDRISDVFEGYAWPSGVEAVWFDNAVIDKTEPSWWVTQIIFRVLFNSAIETA